MVRHSKMDNDESQGKMKTMTRILIFVAILPLELLALLATPIQRLSEAIRELWQMTYLPEHGMYATMALRMKENAKHGDDNGRTN